MQNHTSTDTHTQREYPYVLIKVIPSDIEVADWAFLREWADRLGVTLEGLLKRILIAGVTGNLYAEKIPEI